MEGWKIAPRAMGLISCKACCVGNFRTYKDG